MKGNRQSAAARQVRKERYETKGETKGVPAAVNSVTREQLSQMIEDLDKIVSDRLFLSVFEQGGFKSIQEARSALLRAAGSFANAAALQE